MQLTHVQVGQASISTLSMAPSPQAVSSLQSPCRSSTTARAPLLVVAQKKVQKKSQVVLTRDIPGVGTIGQLKNVAVGYFRNYLAPKGYATVATPDILAEINAAREAEARAKQQEKARAEAMATALRTIGKFVIKKKVGENDQIFGSVTTAEVVDAIAQQTGKQLDKREVTLPDIKTLGNYDATVRLHPEVVGTFKVVVQREKTVR